LEFYDHEIANPDGGYQPPDPGSNPPIVTADVDLDAAENSSLRLSIIRFGLAISNLHYKLGSIPSFTVVAKDGRAVDAGELYANWLYLDFTITNGVVYRPGYGGENRGSAASGGWVVHIDRLAFLGYDALNEAGRNFLALHELAHTTNAATDFWQSQYLSFKARGGQEDQWGMSAEFSAVENYTNHLAKQIANSLEVSLLENPPHGSQ
jgi:hypothetical protein